MGAFWEGVVAGYGIAIPVGAIAILIVDTGLRRGFGLGFMAGAGAAAADLFYASIAAAAGEVLASGLAPFSVGLRVASALVLFGLGGYGLWGVRRGSGREKINPSSASSHWRTFSQFLGLTLLNPLTIAYFSALILGREAGSTITVGERALFVVGAGLASLSWQTLLAGLGAVAHRHMTPRFQMLTSVVGNLVVLGLGVRILVQLIK
ncbi:MAG: LysE family transporter [Anaerolineales bacterium]|nr:MAG: LysE family transporter [Anaerolineales bacterium]